MIREDVADLYTFKCSAHFEGNDKVSKKTSPDTLCMKDKAPIQRMGRANGMAEPKRISKHISIFVTIPQMNRKNILFQTENEIGLIAAFSFLIICPSITASFLRNFFIFL